LGLINKADEIELVTPFTNPPRTSARIVIVDDGIHIETPTFGCFSPLSKAFVNSARQLVLETQQGQEVILALYKKVNLLDTEDWGNQP
jgi:hypothetical protein